MVRAPIFTPTYSTHVELKRLGGWDDNGDLISYPYLNGRSFCSILLRAYEQWKNVRQSEDYLDLNKKVFWRRMFEARFDELEDERVKLIIESEDHKLKLDKLFQEFQLNRQYVQWILPVILLIVSIIMNIYLFFLFTFVKKRTSTLKISFSFSMAILFHCIISFIWVLARQSYCMQLNFFHPLLFIEEFLLTPIFVILHLNLILIAFNNYFGILWPIKYKQILTGKFITRIIIALWIIPIISFIIFEILLQYFPMQDSTFYYITDQFYKIIFRVTAYVSHALVIYFYSNIFYEIYRSKKIWKKMNAEEQTTNENSIKIKTKAMRTSLLIICIYFFHWIPDMIMIEIFDDALTWFFSVFSKYKYVFIIVNILHYTLQQTKSILTTCIFILRIKELKDTHEKVKSYIKKRFTAN